MLSVIKYITCGEYFLVRKQIRISCLSLVIQNKVTQHAIYHTIHLTWKKSNSKSLILPLHPVQSILPISQGNKICTKSSIGSLVWAIPDACADWEVASPCPDWERLWVADVEEYKPLLSACYDTCRPRKRGRQWPVGWQYWGSGCRGSPFSRSLGVLELNIFSVNHY